MSPGSIVAHPSEGCRVRTAVVILALLLSTACTANDPPRDPAPTAAPTAEARARAAPICGYAVVNAYPHDPAAFTQGLVFADGSLYEGTGERGHSSLRRVELTTGAVLQQAALDDRYFGEGIAVVEESIVQLTWTSGVAVVHDRTTFAPLRRHRYTGEGWGLTFDGKRLVMSDGSSLLHFRDPETFGEIGQVEVHDGPSPVSYLNELEWVRGEILANLWGQERIARIDPDTGRVVAWIDLSGLLETQGRRPRNADVLNGIAFDDQAGRLFVTGKRWPWLFEIMLTGCPDLGMTLNECASEAGQR